jgi:hypothetical protein
MSSMFGGPSSLPEPSPKPLGVDERRVSTNEQAVPVPYMAGRRPMPVTFISEVFDSVTVAVTRDVGKQKSKAGTNYYGSFACLVGHGPFDGMHEILLNGESVWTGNLLRGVGNPDFVDITIAGFGTAKFYFGTETQMPDPYLNAKSGTKHPAYRGLGYFVFYRHFFGFNQTSVQNIEVVPSRYPAVSYLGNQGRVVNDVNPMVCVSEWIENPRIGLGLRPEEGLIDTVGMLAVATQLKTELYGVSSWLTRAEEIRTLLVKLFDYFDGFPVMTVDGKFSVGLARPAADVNALPVVDETLMTKRLEYTPQDWSETANKTIVQFINSDNLWQKDASTYRDRGNFRITEQVLPLTLDRSWITTQTLADKVAQAAGRIAALPEVTGEMTLRRTGTLLTALAPGALFKLNYGPRNIVGMICRVTERRREVPGLPEFSIAWKLDRSYLTAAANVVQHHVKDVPGAPAFPQIATAMILELPLALCPSGILSLAVLAVRPAVDIQGCRVYLGHNYDSSGHIAPESYELMEGSSRFAMHGTLSADYPATTGTVDLELGLLVTWDGFDTSLVTDEDLFDGLADELLVFLAGEILSVAKVVLVAAETYRLFCARGRFNTVKTASAAGAEVYLLRRAEIVALQHPHIQALNTVALKLQTYSRSGVSDLATAYVWEQPVAGKIYASIPPKNLLVQGDGANPYYTTGQNVAIEWTVTEPGREFYQEELLKISTVLQFLNLGLVELGRVKLDIGISHKTISNADLVALLGGEVSFVLRAYTEVIGSEFIIDSAYVQVTVRKI